LILLTFVGTTAFVAGFGVSLFTEYQDILPVPTVAPATSMPRPETPEATSPSPTLPPDADADQEQFQLFWEAWRLVEDNYYGDLPDMQAVTYGAIRGMLETLGDEYTSFVEPRIAEIINEDATGNYEGIGAFVSMREDGKLEIVGLIEGQPAQDAGLEAGDRVLEVNGESIIGYGLYEAITLIRGPSGTQVTLLIERPDVEEPFEMTVTRAEVQIPLVEAEILEEDVAYISLREFSTTADTQLEEALNEMLAQEPVGLVFDLRGNPGGWLDQAVKVSDIFLEEGVVLIERSSDGREDVFRSEDDDIGEAIPLVILVNEGSASASEIVAGAVQARDRGILVGTTTFGKGSVQRPYRLSDGSELRVTIARWFTPADEAIHGQGLTPDIEVPLPEELEQGEDPQLDRAVDYLLNGE
jgi:carboxyl-terminal processing protease